MLITGDEDLYMYVQPDRGLPCSLSVSLFSIQCALKNAEECVELQHGLSTGAQGFVRQFPSIA